MEDLKARLTAAETFTKVVLYGYDTLRSYGVDMKSLREWGDVGDLEDARKLKPQAMAEKVVAYCQRLRNAITAAANRKVNIKLHTDNTKPTDTKH